EQLKEAFQLEYEPIAVLAIGKGSDRIELTPIHADESHAYYRRDGIHYVPKVQADELILNHA
ncbi:MAG: nitroreductase, partial [Bacteroidales bacterium]|nr:nitroreductase [Bacteroidales bacterium]